MPFLTRLFKKQDEPRLAFLPPDFFDDLPQKATESKSGGFLDTLCKIMELVVSFFENLFGQPSQSKDDLIPGEQGLFDDCPDVPPRAWQIPPAKTTCNPERISRINFSQKQVGRLQYAGDLRKYFKIRNEKMRLNN